MRCCLKAAMKTPFRSVHLVSEAGTVTGNGERGKVNPAFYRRKFFPGLRCRRPVEWGGLRCGAAIAGWEGWPMGAVEVHPEIRLLVSLIDQAYEKKAWHGPNLKGSLRGLTAAEAAWRPQPQRRSIAEIVLHAAYWKYIVRRRLRSEKRGSFDLKGSNWFPVLAPLTE